MAEYIEREALIREIKTAQETLQSDDDLLWELNKKYHSGLAWEHRIVLESPAADVAPKVNDAEGGREGGLGHVVHGKWIGLEYDGYADGCPVYDLWECSECGEEVRGEDVPDTHPWCHGCGAKMDAEVSDNA